MTLRPNPETEPSMAKVSWPVQSAFYGRNSHPTKESSPTPCRAAAQSNPFPPANSRRPFCFRRLSEIRCSLASSGLGSPTAVAEGDRWASFTGVNSSTVL